MRKTLLKIFMLLLFCSGYSQKNIWEKTNESEVSTHLKVTRNSMPTAFQLYKLNLSDLKEKLSAAPNDLSGQTSNVILTFPVSNGVFNQFRIYDSPVMEEGLFRKRY